VRLFSLDVSDSAFTRGIPPDSMNVAIRWQEPHFSGSVFSPDYLPEGSALFSFFLEGFENRWSQPAPANLFSYRNLPPGEFRLWAKCTDSFRNEGKPELLLIIHIKPPFWKTLWFLIPAILILVIMIILIVRKVQEIKYRNLLKEMEQRNAIDRERLRISQDMHDEIGSSLTQIAILSEIVKQQDGDPEERNRTVSKISGISGKVVDEMSDIIWAMNPKNDNLDSFVTYLRQHASEYLSTAGIDANLSFPEDCPPVPMTSEQRRNLFLVVKEALHNVVRHSGATGVTMTITWVNGMLDFRIEDNGKGFDPEAVSLSGNGMTTMRKRIGAIGGDYSIASEPGKGTRIGFSVQLNFS
jgi:signal transduction histidine kinase